MLQSWKNYWVNNNGIEYTKHEIHGGKVIYQFSDFLFEGDVIELSIYIIFLRFCSKISPLYFRFLLKSSLEGSWQFILVKQPTIKIKQFIFCSNTNCWLALRFLVQILVCFPDKYGIGCHDKKLQKQRLFCIIMWKINNLWFIPRFQYTITVTNQYQRLWVTNNTDGISAA